MPTELLLETDDRGRVSLAKLAGSNTDRYLARRLANGTVVLQPALTIAYDALQSLLDIQGGDRPRRSRGLADVLRDHGISGPPEPEVVAAARAEIAHRRASGARTLADLSEPEIEAMRQSRANPKATRRR